MGLGFGVSRSALVCMNVMFLACGLALVTGGALVLSHTSSVLFVDGHLAIGTWRRVCCLPGCACVRSRCCSMLSKGLLD